MTSRLPESQQNFERAHGALVVGQLGQNFSLRQLLQLVVKLAFFIVEHTIEIVFESGWELRQDCLFCAPQDERAYDLSQVGCGIEIPRVDRLGVHALKLLARTEQSTISEVQLAPQFVHAILNWRAAPCQL